MPSSFLFTVWAGGGNVPPQLALARRLTARGDTVRMLAHAIREEHPEQAGPEALERLAHRGEALRSRGHGRR